MATRTPKSCAAIAAFGVALRLVLLARPAIVLDRLFVPDDTYYTLTIARSLARGLGPSVDGVHLTSGFQPLIAFLLVPVLRVTTDPDVGFRAALAIGIIADAISTWLLGSLAFRMSGRTAAILASLCWAAATSSIAASLNGLESSLAVAAMLGALAAWDAARAKGSSLAWGLSGTLLGVCLLARVDTVFFVTAVGIASLVRAGARRTALSAAGAFAVVAPWWGYSLARFGTVIPESGVAVREQTFAYAAMGINVRDTIAWAAGAAVGPPLVDSAWLRQALGSGASGIGCAIGIFYVVGLMIVVRRHDDDRVRILAGTSAVTFAFYAVYLPATWFFRRYLLPLHALTALGLAMAFAKMWSERSLRPRLARASIAFAVACSLAAVAKYAWLATTVPLMTVDQGHHGAKGYREPAQQILAAAPAGAVIGSFQSGALGWFANEERIVNLDGVVDGEAHRAFRDGKLAAFARERGVTHLADWDANVRHFLSRSGDSRIVRASLRPIAEAEPQGAHERFVLYAITWPDEPSR